MDIRRRGGNVDFRSNVERSVLLRCFLLRRAGRVGGAEVPERGMG